MFHRTLSSVVAALALAAPAAGHAETPAPERPGPQSAILPDPARMPFQNMLRLRDDETRVADREVRRGEPLVSIPVTYRRTGLVKQDVKGRGLFALGTVFAAAGTPGYWAGEFHSQYSSKPANLWCFFPKKGEKVTFSACLLDYFTNIDSERMAAVVDAPINPLLVQSFSLQNSPRIADAPLMDERPVDIVPDLRLDYVFAEWDSKDADLWVRVGGGLAGAMSRPRAPDGSVTFDTPAGSFRLTQPDPKNRHLAAVTPVPRSTPPQAAGRRQAPAPEAVFEAALLQPETLLRAASPITPDVSPRTASPGAVILRQEIRPGAALKQLTAPQDRERFGEPGAPLFPVQVGERRLACWRQAEVTGDRFYGVKGHCLEDADGRSGHEVLWKDIDLLASSNVVAKAIATRKVLDKPVQVVTAADHVWPTENLEIRYIGSFGETRDAAGVLRARSARFSVLAGRRPDAVQEWRVVEISLDAAGRGTLELSGQELAEIRVLDASGAAEVKVLRGWSTTDAPAYDWPAIVRAGRETLASRSGGAAPSPPLAQPAS